MKEIILFIILLASSLAFLEMKAGTEISINVKVLTSESMVTGIVKWAATIKRKDLSGYSITVIEFWSGDLKLCNWGFDDDFYYVGIENDFANPIEITVKFSERELSQVEEKTLTVEPPGKLVVYLSTQTCADLTLSIFVRYSLQDGTELHMIGGSQKNGVYLTYQTALDFNKKKTSAEAKKSSPKIVS